MELLAKSGLPVCGDSNDGTLNWFWPACGVNRRNFKLSLAGPSSYDETYVYVHVMQGSTAWLLPPNQYKK